MKFQIKAIQIIIIFLISTYSLFSYDWRDSQIMILEKKNINGQIIEKLKDAKYNNFSVTSNKSVSKSLAMKIISLKNKFYSSKNMNPSYIYFTCTDDFIEILIQTKDIQYNKQKLSSYIPSGIYFTYTKELYYNFRMIVEKSTIKMKGYYIDEKTFFNNILEAIHNPDAFRKKRDPEYFLLKLNQLEEKVKALEYKNHTLSFSNIKLLRAVMAFQNTGFFSGPKLITEKKVNFLLELKRNNPKITKDEIEKRFEEQSIEISSKEISILLLVYFNEIY